LHGCLSDSNGQCPQSQPQRSGASKEKLADSSGNGFVGIGKRDSRGRSGEQPREQALPADPPTEFQEFVAATTDKCFLFTA